MPPALTRDIRIHDHARYSTARFFAMGSPCELLIAGVSPDRVAAAARCCATEAWRIEAAWSRYRDDNIVHAIHHAAGQAVRVDDETAALLDFAALCFQLSDGRFDISSGVLRRVWTFDQSSPPPSPAAVSTCLQHVGWHKVTWQRPWLTLPSGMEIDFGGIGKEYAVDRAFLAVQQLCPDAAILVNFGGDLHAGKPPPGLAAWTIAVEDPHGAAALRHLTLQCGALATSGDAHRFVLHEGKRYGHILNPTTGWPVQDAPRSVTVAADSCVQAGMLATFAMLHGADAERFLDEQKVRYWSVR